MFKKGGITIGMLIMKYKMLVVFHYKMLVVFHSVVMQHDMTMALQL